MKDSDASEAMQDMRNIILSPATTLKKTKCSKAGLSLSKYLNNRYRIADIVPDMWNIFAPGMRRGLRFWVLYLLNKQPMNGAEIMDEIEAMTRGWWRPSPGSVYPLLETLTKEGLLLKKEEDGRYELTEKGKSEVSFFDFGRRPRPGSIEDITEELSSYISYLEDIKRKDSSLIAKNKEKLQELSKRLGSITGV
jgi:DNA-binding PadR family transcriptional regulator